MHAWGHLSWARGSDPEKQAKAQVGANEEVLDFQHGAVLDARRRLRRGCERGGSMLVPTPAPPAGLARLAGKAVLFGAAEKYLETSGDQSNGHNDEAG